MLFDWIYPLVTLGYHLCSRWKDCLPICLDQAEKSEIYHKMALAELSQDNYVQARINGDKAAMAAAKAQDEERQADAHVIIGMTLGN